MNAAEAASGVCRACGRVLADENGFCPGCGTPARSDQASAQDPRLAPDGPVRVYSPPRLPWTRQTQLWVGAAVIAVIAMLIAIGVTGSRGAGSGGIDHGSAAYLDGYLGGYDAQRGLPLNSPDQTCKNVFFAASLQAGGAYPYGHELWANQGCLDGARDAQSGIPAQYPPP
jgi:hypothetical protein